MLRSIVLLFLGVFACSTAAVQLKACSLNPVVISAVRLLLASLLLFPIYRGEHGKYANLLPASLLRRTFFPALALAAHFVLWAYGAQITPTAQASLIVNLAPIALPFFLSALIGEKITGREIIATALAICGLALLCVPDAMRGGVNLWGNFICFASMLFFAWYLALGRRNRDFPSVWLYVVPVYFQAGLLCLIFALPMAGSLIHASLRDLFLLAGIALIPTVIGHSLINAAMRSFRGQFVSLANTSQFVFAGTLAWFFFHEIPQPVFYLAALLVLAGIIIAHYLPAFRKTS